jgi:hypothetical protein
VHFVRKHAKPLGNARADRHVDSIDADIEALDGRSELDGWRQRLARRLRRLN